MQHESLFSCPTCKVTPSSGTGGPTMAAIQLGDGDYTLLCPRCRLQVPCDGQPNTPVLFETYEDADRALKDGRLYDGISNYYVRQRAYRALEESGWVCVGPDNQPPTVDPLKSSIPRSAAEEIALFNRFQDELAAGTPTRNEARRVYGLKEQAPAEPAKSPEEVMALMLKQKHDAGELRTIKVVQGIIYRVGCCVETSIYQHFDMDGRLLAVTAVEKPWQGS